MSDLIPSTDEIRALEVMSKHACDSKFFNNLNGYGGIFSIAMFARELGLPVMQCLFGGMTNIQGKIEVAPRMMNLMIRKAGHQIHILKSDEESCVLKGVRKDTGESYECTYTMAEAAKAGLASKSNYKNYGSDMLFARCLSRLARRLFADAIGNSYIEGEIEPTESQDSSKNLNEITIDSPKKEPQASKLTEEQLVNLDALIEQIGDKNTVKALLDYMNVGCIEEILPVNYERTLKILDKKIKEKEKPNESSAVA